MLQRALIQAERSLNRCKQERDVLLGAIQCHTEGRIINFIVDLETMNQSWRDFVLSANRFFSKLEQGSKSDGKSLAWYGRTKHLRKKDDLLNYMHQARHAEEHELDLILEETPMQFSEDIDVLNTGRYNDDGSITVYANKEATISPPGYKVKQVKNSLYGDSFGPPKEHLGITLEHQNPSYLANLLIPTLEGILEEAKGLNIN